MSLEHSRQTCLVDQQTGTAHHVQLTDLTSRLHLTCSTNREKNNKGKTHGRHPSANRERHPQQTSVMRKLDYTSRFKRVIPTLSPSQSSHTSIGHGGRYNMVVTASTSHHPPQNGRREMSRFVHKAANIMLQFFVVSFIEDR